MGMVGDKGTMRVYAITSILWRERLLSVSDSLKVLSRSGVEITLKDVLNYFGTERCDDITDKMVEDFLRFVSSPAPQHEVRTECICA